MTASPRNPLFIYFLIGLALVGYFLPWLNGGSTSLSFGAYDLAEWISLRLPVRPMDTVLLLRVIPVLLAFLLGLFGTTQRRRTVFWWLSALVILLIATALLPPFEFFLDSSQRGDVNYSQQFWLAGAALIAGFLSLSGILRRFDAIAMLITSVIMITITIIGYLQTWVIVESLGIMPQMGFGPVLLIGSSFVLGAVTLVASLTSDRNKKDFSLREVL